MPDDFCSDCTSRRSFLGKATKWLAAGAIAAAGIFGADRKVEGILYKLDHQKDRPPTDSEIDDLIKRGVGENDPQGLRKRSRIKTAITSEITSGSSQ